MRGIPFFLEIYWGVSPPPPSSGEGALGVLEVLENLEDLDINIKKIPSRGFFLYYHNLLV